MTNVDNQSAADIDFTNTLPLAIVIVWGEYWLVCTECKNIREAHLGGLIKNDSVANGRILDKAIEHASNHM